MGQFPPGFDEALQFPLAQALLGRRSRRFFLGAHIPDGPFAFRSRYQPFPLSELERTMLLTAAAGNTGWHYLIMRNARYAPHLANYAGAAGGRTFPSAAGFHTSELFFTDDTGVYHFATRDAPALVGEPGADVTALLAAHRPRMRKLSDGRLGLPAETPFVEGHNTWVCNQPGTTMLFPVADLAQHALAGLCYYAQNGYGVRDDVHGQGIPGLTRFGRLIDLDNLLPLSSFEQLCLAEVTAELASACYAAVLMLQAMGLGGWMYDGIDRHALLGASGDPRAPGLGFRFDRDDRWAEPNETGLPGVFEAYCPPHHRDMRAALEALRRRKFGPGGAFNAETPGPFADSPGVRGSAARFSPELEDCVATQAQYILDRFGKFPGTVPSVFALTYVQAHHLDLEFYDRFFQPGAYLPTHAHHFERWHPGESPRLRS